MMRVGENVVDGLAVVVARKRIRRINLRVKADGRIFLSVPYWGATLATAEAFLRDKWSWVVATRNKILARLPPGGMPKPPTPDEKRALAARLGEVLSELMPRWMARLSEPGVTWKMRPLKTLWGSCHIRKRHILFNSELAHAPRELVEYVVVHELTHLQVPNHGPRFYAMMDARLPGWRLLRSRLNKREYRSEAVQMVFVFAEKG